MKGCDLEASQMSGVNLRVATMKGANLQNCNLRGAILAGADLEVSLIVCLASVVQKLNGAIHWIVIFLTAAQRYENQ